MTDRRRTAWIASTLLAASMPAAAATVGSSLFGHPTSVGHIDLAQLAAGLASGPAPGVSRLASPGAAPEFRMMPRHLLPPGVGTAASAGAQAAALPLAESFALTALVPGNLPGFVGIDHYDQRVVADNGNQFSLEPPDQALAVGNGYVVEAVNNALEVYDMSGRPLLAAPVSTNRFFNQVSEINRASPQLQQGPSLSDPRAYYDPDLKRFFVVEWATLNDASGAPLNISVQFVAVSKTADPTGAYLIYSFETTNPTVKGCPCFPDYQQVGTDKNGLFITANLFGISGSAFAGAKIYAVSKTALANGTAATIVEFKPMPGDFTVHPTVVPPGGSFASAGNGTEYLVESQADLTASGTAKSVNIFAISNTASLAKAAPVLQLAKVSAPSQVYGNASSGVLPPAVQADGPRPLGGPAGLHQPVPLLDGGDARVGSTPVYVDGHVWTVIGTAVTGAQYSYDAVAWFNVGVKGGAGGLQAAVSSQGSIVAPAGVSLLYPVIAMPVGGKGAIGVTVTGPASYPSTAVIPISSAGKTGSIEMSAIGVLPDDGFTAYSTYGGAGVGRWGDYGAASVAEDGTLWLANEFVPDTSVYPRTSLANWGTFVTHYTP